MNKEIIKTDLLTAFTEPDGNIQEQAILKAIKDIGDIENEAGVFSNYMIELRDFLLDYVK
jgi:hypothetical protein